MALPHEKTLVELNADRRIGGSAGKHTYGGQHVDKPENMPEKGNADHVVSNFSELRNALKDDNAVVYYDDHINVTKRDPIWLGENVTLVGQYCDPSVESTGYWIHYDDIPIDGYTGCFRQSSGTPPTFYGVYLLGPLRGFVDHDHTAPDFEDKLRSGAWISTPHDAGKLKFIGCRFTGWTWSGVQIGSHDSVTDAKFYRCTFHQNNYNHYGYGMCTYKGDVWLDFCFFDDNRHHTAGWGYPEETHDITNSVGGPGPGASHSWDMHGTSDGTAGGHVRLRRVTTLQNRSLWGDYQEAMKIRGTPTGLTWVEDCAMPDGRPPQRGNPDRKQAVRQERDEWNNVNPFKRSDTRGGNNYYGAVDGIPDGIGAPTADPQSDGRADQDIKDDPSTGGGDKDPAPAPQPELEEPTQELTVVPKGKGSGNYWIYISGNARRADRGDVVKDVKGKRKTEHVLTGHVVSGWTDTFELGKNASLESMWSTVPCIIEIDDDRVEHQASLYAIEADRKFEHR